MGDVVFRPSKVLATFMKDEEWPKTLPVRPCIGDIIYSNTQHKSGRAMARVDIVLFRDGRMIAILGPRTELDESKAEYEALFK